MKTRRAAAKRFKKTGSGKFSRPQANRRHRLINRSSKQKRRLEDTVVVSDADKARVARMLPYL